jgi:hypothetical protein
MPGYANPGEFTRGYGIGNGGGCGRGRGRRNMFYETGVSGWARYGYPSNMGRNTAKFDEKAFLSNQAEFLENQLQRVKKRLSNLSEEAE